MNFEILLILTDYANLKKGDTIFKKSSPLKLLSQSQPNFAEMILGGPLSKLCPSAPSCIQDGRHY